MFAIENQHSELKNILALLVKNLPKVFLFTLLGIQETKIKLFGLKRNKIMQGYKGIR